MAARLRGLRDILLMSRPPLVGELGREGTGHAWQLLHSLHRRLLEIRLCGRVVVNDDGTGRR